MVSVLRCKERTREVEKQHQESGKTSSLYIPGYVLRNSLRFVKNWYCHTDHCSANICAWHKSLIGVHLLNVLGKFLNVDNIDASLAKKRFERNLKSLLLMIDVSTLRYSVFIRGDLCGPKKEKKHTSCYLEHACQTSHLNAWRNFEVISTKPWHRLRHCLQVWRINGSRTLLSSC